MRDAFKRLEKMDKNADNVARAALLAYLAGTDGNAQNWRYDTHRNHWVNVETRERFTAGSLESSMTHLRTLFGEERLTFLTQNGLLVYAGTDLGAAEYIHKHHPYSMDHALKYEGYSLSNGIF